MERASGRWLADHPEIAAAGRAESDSAGGGPDRIPARVGKPQLGGSARNGSGCAGSLRSCGARNAMADHQRPGRRFRAERQAPRSRRIVAAFAVPAIRLRNTTRAVIAIRSRPYQGGRGWEYTDPETGSPKWKFPINTSWLSESAITRRYTMRITVPCITVGIALLATAAMNAASSGARMLLYVDNSLGDDISVIDLGTLKIVDTIKVGNQPHALCAPADGRRLFATIESEKNLKIIDTITGKILDTVPVTGKPNECAATPNGRYVGVPIRDGNSVDIVDTILKFIWWRIIATHHIAPAKSINPQLSELIAAQFIESRRKNLMNPLRPGAFGLEVYHSVAFRSSKSLERIHISAECPIYRLSLPICRPTGRWRKTGTLTGLGPMSASVR